MSLSFQRYLIALVLVATDMGALECLPVDDKIKKIESVEMIHQALQKANDDFFFSHSIRVDILKNCTQTIPVLAQMLYEEWHTYDASLTTEKLVHSFNMCLNDDKIPITFVAFKNNKPIGTISLETESDPAFSDFPENSVWMGSLQVIPEERKQGLGQELLKLAAVVARCLGYEEMYFYTSNPANVKWYAKRGAYTIEERPFRNHMITIMHLPLYHDRLKNSHFDLQSKF